jgi:hypothetical protein
VSLQGCNNHPTVKATLSCFQCHKPICDKCTKNARFCSDECNAKYSKFYSTYKQQKKSGDYSGFISTIFFLLVIGAAAWVAHTHFHLF